MKKLMRNLAIAVFAVSAPTALTGCDSNSNDSQTYNFVYNFEMATDEGYNKQGYWKDVYDASINQLYLQPNLIITHSAETNVYEGVEYKSWSGFCPSRNTDKIDHAGDWADHQWGSITGGGAAKSMDYLLGYWDSRESLTDVPQNPCCGLGFTAGENYPKAIAVTNSAYGYYAMKNGTDFSRAFGPDDWCKLIFVGVRNGVKCGSIDFYLAQNGEIVNEWKSVDLTPLGKVDAIYIQMQSSDSGQFGMNNPAYFCLDNLVVVCKG